MPLSAAVTTLATDIETAFETKTNNYRGEEAPSKELKAAIDKAFAMDLATAILKFCLQAEVVGVVGGVCTGVAGPLAPAGMTYAGGPVTGMIVPGTGKLV